MLSAGIRGWEWAMAEGSGGIPPPDHGQPESGAHMREAAARAADWITICQSELAAMASDPELQESWVRQVDIWAESAQRALRALAGGADAAGTAAAPGTAAAMAASGARDAALDRLAQRVAELERRLGQLGARDLELPAGPPRA